jgi:uncharacterized cupredoxin-like copper-binding protein
VAIPSPDGSNAFSSCNSFSLALASGRLFIRRDQDALSSDDCSGGGSRRRISLVRAVRRRPVAAKSHRSDGRSRPGRQACVAPSELRFETGKLYKLILRNASNAPHYFTSHGFSQLVWTRKVQVTQVRDGKPVTLAEFKGAIREVEVYPGHAAEWWFVPVAAGRITDLQCGIVDKDGKTHAAHGMTGEIVIE